MKTVKPPLGVVEVSVNTAEPASVAWLDALLTTPGGRDEHFPFIVEDAELKEGKRCCCRPSTSRGPRGGEPGAHPARETPKHRLLPWQAPGGVSVGQAQVYPAPQHLVCRNGWLMTPLFFPLCPGPQVGSQLVMAHFKRVNCMPCKNKQKERLSPKGSGVPATDSLR